MPGKIGKKLIPRKSKSGKWHSVRELVFALLEKNINMDRSKVEAIVMKEYPESEFVHKDGKGGHFPWYKHKFQKMKLEADGFIVKDNKEEEVDNVTSIQTNKRGRKNKKDDSGRDSAVHKRESGKASSDRRNGDISRDVGH